MGPRADLRRAAGLPVQHAEAAEGLDSRGLGLRQGHRLAPRHCTALLCMFVSVNVTIKGSAPLSIAAALVRCIHVAPHHGSSLVVIAVIDHSAHLRQHRRLRRALPELPGLLHVACERPTTQPVKLLALKLILWCGHCSASLVWIPNFQNEDMALWPYFDLHVLAAAFSGSMNGRMGMPQNTPNT